MFVLDRIKMLKIMDEGLIPPKDFEVEEFIPHGLDITRDELCRVRIRISSD